MNFIGNIILAALYIVLFASSIIFIWILIFRPKWFNFRYDLPYFAEGWARITPWVNFGAIISLIAILWIGLDKVLFFIPESIRMYLKAVVAPLFAMNIFMIVVEYRRRNFKKKEKPNE